MKVAICCIIKNENNYLKEWISWHKNLGVDNILLWDNNDTNGENPNSVIKDYIDSKYVIYHNYRGNNEFNRQALVYKKTYDLYKDNYDWIGFFDIDEFVVLKTYSDIKGYLSQDKFKDFEQILLKWRIFGDNGYLESNNNFDVVNRFTTTSEYLPNVNTKYFLRTSISNEISFDSPHSISLPTTTCDSDGNKILPCAVLICEGECFLNHYLTKSLEEFLHRHTADAVFNMDIIWTSQKLVNYFQINPCSKTLEAEKIIKKQHPWYTFIYPSKIDAVIVDHGSGLLDFVISSIKTNLSWIDNIYVVSNNYTTENVITISPDKISENNSLPVEMFLHNISELSERFLMINDTTIFNIKCLEKEFFIGGKLCAGNVLLNKVLKQYQTQCFNNHMLIYNQESIIKNEKDSFCKVKFNTCCIPMFKSDNKACFEYLKDEFFKYPKAFNHFVYTFWSEIVKHVITYDYTNVIISSEEELVEISDPCYKIISIDSKLISKVIPLLQKRLWKK